MLHRSPILVELAKSNPTTNIDKGRLKWIEVNAMAATIHHIYERNIALLENSFLEDIGESMELDYPSWLAKVAADNPGANLHSGYCCLCVTYILP